MAPRAALFDVDGTLVDTNYFHTVAWWQAFRAHGIDVGMAAVHRCIGMGSDQLVGTLVEGADDKLTETLAASHTRFYGPFLEHARAFPGAADLLRDCAGRGLRTALASSAKPEEAQVLRAAIGADDVVEEITTSGDADTSKPAPDILQAAVDRLGLDPGECVLVGDTVWDVQAAGRAGMPCVGVRSGGISEAELRDAGAVEVWGDVADLRAHLERSALLRDRE